MLGMGTLQKCKTWGLWMRSQTGWSIACLDCGCFPIWSINCLHDWLVSENSPSLVVVRRIHDARRTATFAKRTITVIQTGASYACMANYWITLIWLVVLQCALVCQRAQWDPMHRLPCGHEHTLSTKLQHRQPSNRPN